MVSIVFCIVKPEVVDFLDVLKMFLPVSTNAYWYFTAYTGLFVLIPLLNLILRHSSEKFLKSLLIIFFLFLPFLIVS